MAVPLKVLIIEDSDADTELLLHALGGAGYDPVFERVQTAEQMRRALQKPGWEIVISDYVLPSFSGLEALNLLQESELDIPFLILSGKIGEEVAVEALKAGADDYLLKDRMTRLGPAVGRALRESAQRRKRRQAENALRESEERYRRLVESCPDAMFISVDGRFVYVNPAAVKLFGANSPLELVGKAVLELIEPSYRELVEEYLRQALDGLDGPLLEHKINKLDSSLAVVESIARVIHYHGEEGVQVLCRDVTSRKQLESQVVSTQKMEAISRLAGGVANDFNNLLTVVTGYTGLIRSGLSPDHPLQRDLNQISKSTERAISLTNQLLALSRKEAAAPEPLKLNLVIEQTMPLLRRIMGEQIECRTALSQELFEIKADRGQMETLIINLAVQARESMPEGGKLMIETSNHSQPQRKNPYAFELKPGEYAVLTVADTGRGISDEIREHVFEPFYLTSEIGKSTGLGLATVYAIVKQHGGQIWCTSEIGRGSTFRIYLPRMAVAPKPPMPRRSAPPKAGADTILIVEDEDVLRDFANLVLRRSGYDVLVARDGAEALQVVETASKPIKLVFTDVVMPRMNGAELARRLQERLPNIPVLFTSGYPRTILFESGFNDENAEFLQKPYTTQTLLERIRKVLTDSAAA